jgi:hypothetical protein
VGAGYLYVDTTMTPADWDRFSEESRRLLAAIGNVVVTFQLLELWVAEALGSALKFEHGRKMMNLACSRLCGHCLLRKAMSN